MAVTTQEFASKFRTQFPGQFDDVNDIELSRQIIAKRPELKQEVDFQEESVDPFKTEVVQQFEERKGESLTDTQAINLTDQAVTEQAQTAAGQPTAFEQLPQPLPFQQKTTELMSGGGKLLEPFKQEKTSTIPMTETMAFKDERKKRFDAAMVEAGLAGEDDFRINTPTFLPFGLLQGKSHDIWKKIDTDVREEMKDQQAVVNNEGTLQYALKPFANAAINIANLPTETLSFLENIQESVGGIAEVTKEFTTNPEFRQEMISKFPSMMEKGLYEQPVDAIGAIFGGVQGIKALPGAAAKLPGVAKAVPGLVSQAGEGIAQAGKAAKPLLAEAGQRAGQLAQEVPGQIAQQAQQAGQGLLRGAQQVARVPGQIARAPGILKDKLDIKTGVKSFEKKFKTTEEQIAKAAGAITQATEEAKNIAVARTFDRLDLKGTEITDYRSLRGKVDSFAKDTAKQQDDLLGQSNKTFTLDELKTSEKVGNELVESAPFIDALDDLEAVYKKLNQPKDASRIRQLKQKAEVDGITINEQNQIAREYGMQESGFSDRTGKALTSTNAKGRENIRRELKTILRNNADSEGIKGSKDIDATFSDAATTKRLMAEMEKKVNNISNKIENLNRGQQAARFASKVFTAMTFGVVRELGAGILTKSNQGMKSLNYLSIQDNLNNNIKILDKLFKKLDETKTISKQKAAFREAEQTINKSVTVKGGNTKPTKAREGGLLAKADVESEGVGLASKTKVTPEEVSFLDKLIEQDKKRIADPIEHRKAGDNYITINKLLRDGKANSDATLLSETIRKLPNYDGKSYRGLSISNKQYNELLGGLKEGDVYTDKGFIASSKDPNSIGLYLGLEGGSDGNKQIMMIIDGKKGKELPGSSELEVLFDKGSKFNVKKVDTKEGIERIFLEEANK